MFDRWPSLRAGHALISLMALCCAAMRKQAYTNTKLITVLIRIAAIIAFDSHRVQQCCFQFVFFSCRVCCQRIGSHDRPLFAVSLLYNHCLFPARCYNVFILSRPIWHLLIFRSLCSCCHYVNIIDFNMTSVIGPILVNTRHIENNNIEIVATGKKPTEKTQCQIHKMQDVFLENPISFHGNIWTFHTSIRLSYLCIQHITKVCLNHP